MSAPVHSAGCRCGRCPSASRLTGNQAAAWSLAGFGTAALLIQLIAQLTGAPGVRVIFGF